MIEKEFFVMLDRVQLKREAKMITKNAKVSAYLFTLLYLVIVYLLDLLDLLTSGVSVSEVSYYLDMFGITSSDVLARLSQPIFSLPTTVVLFLGVVIRLTSMVLGAGYIIYTLSVRRGLYTSYGTLFDGFIFAGKVILLEVLITIFVFLWSLLLVFPGIIASYRYRFALYNLCEHPSMSVMEALRMSKAQTRGHKWQLFVLDLSFIGWNLLCSLTLGILSIWIMPYIQQTDIGYFVAIRDMSGIGSRPPEDDGQFHPDDRFNDGRRDYDPER